jgi:hypothetical protein
MSSQKAKPETWLPPRFSQEIEEGDVLLDDGGGLFVKGGMN